MNKVLNQNVFLSFLLSGVSYASSNFQKLQHLNLFFVNVIFLKDGLHYVTYSEHGNMQDNVIQSEDEMSKKRQLWGQGKQLF